MSSNWLSMNRYELRQFAKKYVKEKFTQMGIDILEAPNYSDGADFEIRLKSGDTYKINVRSVRKPGTGYAFIEKERFNVNDEHLLLVLILFYDTTASLYGIPATEWKTENRLLRNRQYAGLKSKPEWGINVTERNMDILKKYEIMNLVEPFKNSKGV